MKIRISLPENVSRKLKTSAFTFLLLITFYFFLPAQAIAGWEWINPLPQGNNLNDIIFVGKDLGWSVGNFGTIYQTTDGGKNWSVTKTDFTTNLTCVCFADANNGWACGESGKIYFTSDGINWKEQTTNTAIKLNAVSFCDKNNGFAAGDSGLVLMTNDGGSNWVRLINAPHAFYSDVACVSPGVGYFSAQYADFIKTTDAGITWDRKNLINTTTINKMKFLDSLNGFMACNSGVIFHTTDGGINWDMFNPYTWLNLRDISFFNTKYGIAIGDNGYTLKTTDGGLTWTEQKEPSDLNFSDIYIINLELIFALNNTGYIFKSTDFGVSWEIVSNAFCYENLYSVYFQDSDNGWVGGNKLYRTTDGGKSWNLIKLDLYDYSLKILSIKFLNKNFGCIVGRSEKGGLVLRTTDGGISWSYNYKGFIPLNVFILDSNILFICGTQYTGKTGNQRMISKSIDGGKTWNLQLFPSSFGYELQKFAFTDNNHGFAVGYQAYFTTNNCGETWKEAMKYNEGLNNIFFLNSSIGWIVGNYLWAQDIIKKTTDGGLNWIDISAPGQCFLPIDVYFSDLNNGWMLCSDPDSNIVRTTDGGSTWKTEEILTNTILNMFSFPNSKVGYAVGDNGTILKYTGEDIINVEEEIIDSKSVDIEIYPNPVEDFLYLRHTEFQSNIEIFTSLGTKVFECKISEIIDVSVLPPGIYFLKSGSSVSKFVKI
jgi:photosystem II stability/assembly factor-like uncharacterized protein